MSPGKRFLLRGGWVVAVGVLLLAAGPGLRQPVVPNAAHAAAAPAEVVERYLALVQDKQLEQAVRECAAGDMDLPTADDLEELEGLIREAEALLWLKAMALPEPGLTWTVDGTEVDGESAEVQLTLRRQRETQPTVYLIREDGAWKIDLETTCEGMLSETEIASPFRLARAKEDAASCQSNLKQLAIAALMYRQDHDERMPRAENWSQAIQPYCRNDKIFRCPAAPDLEIGYAYNANLSGGAFAEHPAEIYLFLDSNETVARGVEAVARRHNGGANFAYLDGHVQWSAEPEAKSFGTPEAFASGPHPISTPPWTEDTAATVPVIRRGGVPYVPLREAAASARAEVQWDAFSGAAMVCSGPYQAAFRPGQARVSVEGRTISLPAPVVQAEGRLLVPAEGLSKALGWWLRFAGERVEVRNP
jgi:prepilin-type processing-associated H-X9-DG protein